MHLILFANLKVNIYFYFLNFIISYLLFHIANLFKTLSDNLDTHSKGF